jgi:DNA-binding transcriptional LysR family regulator
LALHDWGRLKPVIVPLHDAPTWTVEVVWHAERYLPAAAGSFRDFVQTYLAAHPLEQHNDAGHHT